MSCLDIVNGLDMTCRPYFKKYWQHVVLINKSSVNEKLISVGSDEECLHRITFNLNEGETGFRIQASEKGNVIFGSFAKTVKEGINQYTHSVQILVMGVEEEIKCFLKQIDSGEYFAAIQFMDGTVEIYGFDHGLKTSDYTYDPQSGQGGSVIVLASENDALEDYPPYVYVSSPPGNESEDFDNDFQDIPDFLLGDFNYDFSYDFYID